MNLGATVKREVVSGCYVSSPVSNFAYPLGYGYTAKSDQFGLGSDLQVQ